MPLCIVNLITKSPQLQRCNGMLMFKRSLTSSEVSTALRPFYFNVHPDLFGQFPTERAINETSLKTLSSLLEHLLHGRPTPPTTLTFYIRPQSKSSSIGSLKQVRIRLSHRNIRDTVTTILSTCELPTSYVDNIQERPKPKEPKFTKQYGYSNEQNVEINQNPDLGRRMRQEVKQYKENESLSEWLSKNYQEAKDKLEKTKPIREDVEKLRMELCSLLELKGIKWDCGWDISHFKGCLVSFQALCEHYRRDMDSLKGRNVVFGNNTGVILDGTILLNSGEVRHNWLDFIKKFWKDDKLLRTVPAYEKAVSRVLKDINIARRKFQPKTMVKDYENNLRRLTTALSDYQGRYGFPRNWPATLKDYELVIESEAGPLMVSPTGQFIVPASCPPSLLVHFISDHLDQAKELLTLYKTNKHIERDLHLKCVSALNLSNLQKDDSVNPDFMIKCCERLLSNSFILKPLLSDTRLSITTYYSVMSDGEICIPWNWKL